MFNKSYCTLFFLLLSQSVLSSGSFDDNTQTYKNKIDDFLLQAEETRKSDARLFKSSLQHLSDLKKQSPFSDKQQCYYDYLQSFSFAYSNQYDSANQALNHVFETCNDPVIKIKSKLLLANLNVISKNYVLAISDLNFALKSLNQVNDLKLKRTIYSIASLVYRLVEQPELSLRFSNLLLSENPGDIYKCSALVNKYRLLLEQGFNDNYRQKINTTLSLCEKNKNFIQSNFLKLDWMNANLSQQNNSTQIKLLLNQLISTEDQIYSTKYQNLISVMDNLFAKIYWKLGDKLQAIEYAQKSIFESEGIERTKQEVSSLQILIDYNKRKGNLDRVIEYLEKQSKSKLTNHNEKQAKFMAYQTVNHDNFAKTKQIELLNQKNKVLALENNLSEKSAQVQKLVILLLIAVTGFFVLWGLWQRRSQRIYKELSERDHMTSIFNRNGLRKYTESLLAYSQENDTQVGCAVFDLDWFKKINDQYGHATGDWTIKNVIKKCESLGNNKATFGRLGGEEFAIILSDTNKEELYVFCENCRNAINSLKTKDSGYEFKISASFGMTTSIVSGLSYSNLLIHADEALYQAKHGGRNNTVIYQQEI